MKYLLTLVLSAVLLFSSTAYAGNYDIQLDYDKMTLTIDGEVITMTKEQKESFKEWKKMLDEDGPTNDLNAICPHLNDMMNVADDDAGLIKFAKAHPNEMMIVKYNLKLRAEKQAENQKKDN